MRLIQGKERLKEVKVASASFGLWSRYAAYSTEIFPVGKTLETLGRFLPGDFARWDTWDEMRRMMAAKGWRKSSARKLAEYAAQYRGLGASAPAWFLAWSRFAGWLQNIQLQEKRDPRVRISFGYAAYGSNCFEERVRGGHAFLLRIGGVLHVAVVLHEGAAYWQGLLQTSAAVRHHERYALLVSGRHVVVPVSADIIDEMLALNLLFFFFFAPDPLLEAVLSDANADESLAYLSRSFEFYLTNPGGGAPRFEFAWSLVYNPRKGKLNAVVKTKPRILEVMDPRDRPWTKRPVPVTDIASVDAVARRVVLTDGYAQLPPDAPKELVQAMSAALFFITFPDRRPEEPGGILNGYQLPERVMFRATGPVRGGIADSVAKSHLQNAARRLAAKRALVVETLVARAAKIVARRNGMAEDEARRRIGREGGAELLEKAAWRLGMMEGNALVQFKGGDAGGVLKLPDLSLAAAFEQMLGLDGGNWREGSRLVQTVRIAPLAETVGRSRHCVETVCQARRMWNGDVLRDDYPSDTVRILRDGESYYVLIVPRFSGGYKKERDLLFDPAAENGVPVPGYRFVSGSGRARDNIRVERDDFDMNKVMTMAREGRMALYSIDFGKDRPLADAAYSESNIAPCRLVASTPQIVESRRKGAAGSDAPGDMWKSVFKVTFTANPQSARENVGARPRSWLSYAFAYPDDRRPQVRWPSGADDARDAEDAVREMAEKDGVLITDSEHAAEALAAAGYVIMPGRGSEETGGAYCGYTLTDRVFLATDGRWNASEKGENEASNDTGRQSSEIHRSILGSRA